MGQKVNFVDTTNKLFLRLWGFVKKFSTCTTGNPRDRYSDVATVRRCQSLVSLTGQEKSLATVQVSGGSLNDNEEGHKGDITYES
jgi:hypothetical protein